MQSLASSLGAEEVSATESEISDYISIGPRCTDCWIVEDRVDTHGGKDSDRACWCRMLYLPV
jgi:hypothetical protein